MEKNLAGLFHIHKEPQLDTGNLGGNACTG